MTKKIKKMTSRRPEEFKSIVECENLTEGEVALSDEAMVRISNEESVLRRENYPFLNLNGKNGTYELNKEELEGEIGIIMLKFRQSYFVFSPDGVLNTEEFDKIGEKVKLFRSRKGEKTEEIDNNTVEELKKIYTFPTGKIIDGKPEMNILKMKQIIYSVILTKTRIPQIVKFVVKGTAARELFSFYKEFAYGEHIFNYIVELGAKSEKNKRGEEYKIPVYKKGRILNNQELDAVRKAMLMIEQTISTKVSEPEPEYRGEEANPNLGDDVEEIFGPEAESPDAGGIEGAEMPATELQQRINYAKDYPKSSPLAKGEGPNQSR